MRSRGRRILNNQRGIALLESVPLMVIFVMLMSFGVGLFGVVHTAILHSIAARAYSFETFRQRTNLSYFREDGSGLSAGTAMNFTKKGWRYQAVQHENDPRPLFVATVRPIALGNRAPAGDNTEQQNNQGIYTIQDGARNTKYADNPVWIMVGYGICINATCGGN
jgi:hypothetical protein